jgi:hypothetical protein
MAELVARLIGIPGPAPVCPDDAIPMPLSSMLSLSGGVYGLVNTSELSFVKNVFGFGDIMSAGE